MAMRIRRILVAIKDPKRPPRAQLRKAATLARASGATVELFHTISIAEVAHEMRGERTERSSAEIMDSIAAEMTRRLERLARPVARGVRVVVRPSWDYPPHEAVIRHATASRADLVIAAAQPARAAGRLFLANTDWELIRRCPLPVLIVKSSGDYRSPALVAAVDPFHAHAKPAKLDQRILAAGDAIRRLLKGTLDIFHSYLPLPMVVASPGGSLGMELPPEWEDVHTAQVDRTFQKLAQTAHIPAERRHLHMGVTQDELGAVARRLRAKIIVMGGVSRSALKRALIGNTAESVLDNVGCDVLVVKPAGFRSNIPRKVLHVRWP